MNKAFIPFLWENEPSAKTPIDEDNLNSINTALDVVDDRVITLNSTKLDKTTANTMVQDVSLDKKTGIFTITKLNGSTVTIDTKLEKLAINWKFDKDAQQLIIILDDGTEQTVDLSALITQYEFKESDTIVLSVDSDGKVYGTIKKGSITGDYLEPNYLAKVTEKADTATLKAKEAEASATAAKASETNAKESETNAANSAVEASASKTSASGFANNAANSATLAEASATAAKASETNAKESETNAAVSANSAKESATNATESANNASTKATEAEKSATNAANSATLAEASAVRSEKAAEKAEAIAEFTIDADLSEESVNPVQNKAVTKAINDIVAGNTSVGDADTLDGKHATSFLTKNNRLGGIAFDADNDLHINIDGTEYKIPFGMGRYDVITTSGGKLTGNLTMPNLNLFDGVRARNVISIYDDGDDKNYGAELVLTASGNSFIGSGESPFQLRTYLNEGGDTVYLEYYSPTDERLYLVSDSSMYFVVNANTIANRKVIQIGIDGVINCPTHIQLKSANADALQYRLINSLRHIVYSINNSGQAFIWDVTNAKALMQSNLDGTTIFYGNATSADKLNTSAGSGTYPVYFSDGKPVACTYQLNARIDNYAGSLASDGWSRLGGQVQGASIIASYNREPAPWNSSLYSSSLAFGSADTKGLIDCSHGFPIVTFGGGSIANSTADSPNWWFKLSGTSKQTYTLPTSGCTLASADTTAKRILHTIDLTNTSTYNEDTYYPVAASLDNRGYNHIVVAAQLNGSTPSWSTHSSGFTCNLDILVKGSGWGTTDAHTIVLDYTYKYANANPVGYIQLENRSWAVLYLRGGGKYFVYTDWDAGWTVYTSTYTYEGKSIAPTTTNPGVNFVRATIMANVQGSLTGTATMAQHLQTYSEIDTSHGESYMLRCRYNLKGDGRFRFQIDNPVSHEVGCDYATTAGSASANDVYSWAKQSAKPTYTATEVGAVAMNGSNVATNPVSDVNQFNVGVGLFSGGTLNLPTKEWWLIVSGGTPGTITQIAYTLFNTQTPRMRYCASGTWSAWQEVNRNTLGGQMILHKGNSAPVAIQESAPSDTSALWAY